MTKKAETQIATAMQIYRNALAMGTPARTVDFIKAFLDAGVGARYMEPARQRLGIRIWQAEDGFIWVAPPIGGFTTEPTIPTQLTR